jgi:spore germination protein
LSIFRNNDNQINETELMHSIASMIISIGVLTLPRDIAEATDYADGWVSLAAAGICSLVFVWVLAKLTSRFPRQSYYEYTSSIITRPLGMTVTVLFAASYFIFAAYELRALAEVAKHYLFTTTPIEVIAFIFWMVVIYAVCGSRIGLLRLNLLFFPIVVAVVLLTLLLNVGGVELNHFRPLLVTDWKGIAKGAQACSFSFLGFEIILAYGMYLNKPQHAVRAGIKGVLFPFALYVLLYLFIIGVFSNNSTSEIVYPTVELAKEAEVPGSFLERFESIFFTIWIMTIFNTTAMGFDVCLLSISSLLPKISKMKIVGVLAPLIYLITFIPEDKNELSKFGSFVSLSIIGSCIALPLLIYLIAKWRGVKANV